MTPASKTTGAVAALLVFLGQGLFGSTGWLAALVLAVLAGAILAGMVSWMIDGGPAAMDGAHWAPVAEAAPAGPVAAPVSEPVPAPRAAPTIAPSGDAVPPVVARELPDPARTIYGRKPAEAPESLRGIKGIGVKVEQALHEAGVTRLAQIAAWDDAQIDAMAARIGRGAARIRNDDWVGQAKALTAARQEGV